MAMQQSGPTRRDGFEAFFSATCQRVVGLAAVVTGDARLAEDAAQEAYLRALRRWGEVSSMDRPDLWVAKVAAHVAVDRWRRQRREAPLESGAGQIPARPAGEIDRLWLAWGLEQLSPMQRAVVLLKDAEGYPVKDIAGQLGRSPETVKTHLAKGRARLRRLLAGEEEQP